MVQGGKVDVANRETAAIISNKRRQVKADDAV
jgi:hypothetical protein